MTKLRIILQSKYLYIFLIIFLLIYAIYSTIIIKHNSIYTNETIFKGIVNNYKIDGNKVSILFKDKENLIGVYYLKNTNEKQYFLDNLLYGSFIEINGDLINPSNNTIPNTFNYKNYLYNKRIYKTINIDNIKIDNSNINFFYNLKNKINSIIDERENSSYIKTFILGDKSSIDINESEKFKILGISHLFAISGMHITLFSSVIIYLLAKLKKSKKTALLISIIILFIYGLLCSFPSSIKRAYIMFALLSLNKIFKLNIKNINILNLTIVINILIEPFIIYDIGFLYSVATTYGLILSSNCLNKGNYLTKLFKVSLIAFLFSLPITINNNYLINIMTPINNIIIVPLVSLIIYPLSILSLFIPILNPIFNTFISLLSNLNLFLKNINIFNIIIPKMNIIFIIIYYIGLVLTIYKKRKYLISCILIIIFNILLPYFDSSKYIYFLDVNQGDSAVIIDSNKKSISLIDTGGKVSYDEDEWKKTNTNYKLSDNTITFLHSLGIYKINNFIITHGDFDHMGEAINLVNNFKVEKVIFNCGEYNDLEKELIKVLDKKNIKYYSCIKELTIDNNKLYFLQTKEYDNENDNSNVIYTELNGYKFMFMGDASITTEKKILDKYNLQNIDVLKVGHHGSKTSSSKEFINEINPKYSIISVGKKNRYGHPNKEVLDNLENSKIYRTDQDGSIMFKIKNNKLNTEKCIS